MIVNYNEHLSSLPFAKLDDGELNLFLLVFMHRCLELAENISWIFKVSKHHMSVDVNGNQEVFSVFMSYIHT